MLMEQLFTAKSGNDSLGITVSFNTSTMYGGEGNDTIWISKGASAYLQGDLGADSIYFNDTSFNNSTIYGGNLSDATSADGADTIHISGTAAPATLNGNGGNDTIYVGGTALSSSIYGGQGSDDISVVGSISNSVVSGNLGNDTMDFTTVVKSSTIYGGGGFLYDTSLDGADSIEIGGSLTASLLHGNGGNDSFYLDPLKSYNSTVYGGQGADLISQSGSDQSITANLGLLETVARQAWCSTVLPPSSTPPFLVLTSPALMAGNDSLSIAATTIQTSTVYGGAGNDTIIFGGATPILKSLKRLPCLRWC